MWKILFWSLAHRKYVLRSSDSEDDQSISAEKLALFNEIVHGVSAWVHEGDLKISA